jgi:hypothetical protein
VSNYINQSGILELKDVTGKQVYYKSVTTGNGDFKTSIDVSGFPSGAYLLQLSLNGKKAIARRIILSK